ncbi:MAG: hypothetical protein JO219_08165 [Candidatus Eremiobacteraeota bacterium]|nr:hypothetical protein [Candidatus Eremiobacteraeota bacterium]MBV8366163.1 hypothetical protein [Candidatus Eremiobacteraeota bacterium]
MQMGPCSGSVKSDSLAILGTAREPKAVSLRPPLPKYMTRFRPGIAYFSYELGDQRCKLAHLDVRWSDRNVPLALTLPGGNLESILLTRTNGQPTLVVVDRWGRHFTQPLETPPEGLTLWGGSGPLHAGLTGSHRNAVSSSIVVGMHGPALYAMSGQSWPPEWDNRLHRFVPSPGVYVH